MAGTLDFAFCGSRPLRISWLIVGMKPFTSLKLLYRGAKNAKNRGAFRPPGPRDATAMFKLFARSRNAYGSAGEAAYSRERDMGQRGKIASCALATIALSALGSWYLWKGTKRMSDYLLLFAIVLGVNLLPAFGPPTWSILV